MFPPKSAETIVSVHPNDAPGIQIPQIPQIHQIRQIRKWDIFGRSDPGFYTRRGS